MAHIYLL